MQKENQVENKIKFKKFTRELEYCFILFIFFLLAVSWIIGINMMDTMSVIKPIRNINYSEYDNCKNLTLDDTAYCIYYDYKTLSIPDYNETKLWSVIMDYGKLKNEGGLCRQWAYLNKDLMEHFGYKSKIVEILNGLKDGHVFVITYDEKYHCVLNNNLEPTCYEK